MGDLSDASLVHTSHQFRSYITTCVFVGLLLGKWTTSQDFGGWTCSVYVILSDIISASVHLSVLALTVKIRKSQDFLAPISGSPGDQFFFTHLQKFNLNILKLSFME